MSTELLAALLGVCLSGCSAFRNNAIHGPDTPKALKTDKVQDQEVVREITNFYFNRCLHDTSPYPSQPAAALPASCGTAVQERNTIVFDLKNIIDNNYDVYARHFQQTDDTATFAGEVSAASLTAVATLVGVGDLKDILTTASTLTQSTTVSVQKDFFQQKTEYAILAEMDADRAKEWSVILQETGNDIDTYTLSNALNDLQQYKRAGTATAALTAITQQAGAQNSQSNQTIKTTLGVN